MEKEPQPNQPTDILKKNQDNIPIKGLEELCVDANQVLDVVFFAMQKAHEETSEIYSKIRERLLSGGEATEDDRNRLEGAIQKWQTEINRVYCELCNQENVGKNFILGQLLQMRVHRIHSLPFGGSHDDESSYSYYLEQYLETKDATKLPTAKELNLSDLYITPEELKLSETNLYETLALSVFVSVGKSNNIKNTINFPKEGLLVNSYRTIDFEVFMEIISNAVAAMPNGGELKVIGGETEDKKHLLIRISDTGHGMSPDILQKALAGGFTTKPSGTGRGLGLVKSYFENIHHGEFKIESEVGKGTTISIILPLAEKG
ncbi:MAG: PAS/PAC sensor signal transduction histidine kinase [Candidatus Uhrbacteria bacterium GW2011_GWF2_41_16]|uniref:histidine kinase n=2 Tax=Candidatus Uhriibacteriota TaxID=1752732 RepID=A0A0G0VE78_9BACT|nr:MAG: PAS/PAC sensor signal transduction histidine kinase [Candidatus Uhrbacteria bacterium GW2011_GWC2_41_11]KKR97981.1 MAG: PAS/PAC sensor signal transduction histidine kinase [Candidatus Uhrbacteria bacterium GW2011_GWF2_41_16]OFZ66936.1 MAG: hypothetical protein A2328_07725 [Bdellovibrionales bacterium RIFOXYB2_FULL_36_6]